MKTHDTKKTQTIIIAYNLHMYIQFHNSTILHENTCNQKNSNNNHWLLLTYCRKWQKRGLGIWKIC